MKSRFHPAGAFRRLPFVCACVFAAACSGGDGATGPREMEVRVQVASPVTGAWQGYTSVLICAPQVRTTATGEGRAVWTGGTSTLTAPYGKYTYTHSAEEMAALVGGDGVSAGQPLTATLPKAGYASFTYAFTLNYAVEGSGQTRSVSASFDCNAPP